MPAAKVDCYTQNPDQFPPPPKPGQAYPPLCGRGCLSRDGIEVHVATMADFCRALTNLPLRVDRRLFIDKTGPGGRFDFELKFSADSGVPIEPNTAPVIVEDLELLEDALGRVGLKLVAAQGPDDVLVIDHSDRPTPN